MISQEPCNNTSKAAHQLEQPDFWQNNSEMIEQI